MIIDGELVAFVCSAILHEQGISRRLSQSSWLNSIVKNMHMHLHCLSWKCLLFIPWVDPAPLFPSAGNLDQLLRRNQLLCRIKCSLQIEKLFYPRTHYSKHLQVQLLTVVSRKIQNDSYVLPIKSMVSYKLEDMACNTKCNYLLDQAEQPQHQGNNVISNYLVKFISKDTRLFFS